ncbi:putative DNA ligase III [Paratrimastix pyriformis]|uniref:DNA ligase III n=1 Tax=Paratrimastix pyriformis TaxID=342808 RepID=A0ABQ8USF0_9EUKA|nr:putative DNA ligase III [Paratrimastix pyriformis]
MAEINKFPRTKHLLDMGHSVGRDDLLMDPREVAQWIGQNLSVEEKIDGTNLGFSLGPDGSIQVQNRSHYVTSNSQTQFKALDIWISQHRAEIYELLEPGRMLFGEWMYAKHSIPYDKLPGYFVAFDLWDNARQAYLSRQERDRLLSTTTIPVVPLIYEGVVHSEQQLRDLVAQGTSRFRTGAQPLEGIYLRWDDPATGLLVRRSKIVRAEFIVGIEEGDHWTSKTLVRNTVAFE